MHGMRTAGSHRLLPKPLQNILPSKNISADEWIALGMSMLPDHACAAHVVLEEAQQAVAEADQAKLLPYVALALNECGQHQAVIDLSEDQTPAPEVGDLWHVQLAVAHVELGRYDGALDHLHKVSDTSPLAEHRDALLVVCGIQSTPKKDNGGDLRAPVPRTKP